MSVATTRGLLLFAHGARDPRWAEPFEAVAARVRELAPWVVVELGYLELMAPTVADAGARLATQGCTRVDVLPLFLGAGGHVRKDVPTMVLALSEAHPGTEWHLQRPVGEAARVIEAMAETAAQLLIPREPTP
ncbi:MAG: CbiX/SirB N-terminal domain-containing protein [Pseudomonadota bacterium]|nr:CbiX/SirB N-terminal domain-containing protein [Pseudomonadota bacterium]